MIARPSLCASVSLWLLFFFLFNIRCWMLDVRCSTNRIHERHQRHSRTYLATRVAVACLFASSLALPAIHHGTRLGAPAAPRRDRAVPLSVRVHVCNELEDR